MHFTKAKSPNLSLHTLNLRTASETWGEEICLVGLLRPRGSSVCQVISSQYVRGLNARSRRFLRQTLRFAFYELALE